MRIPSVYDKLARQLGEWLTNHNFRESEIWPAKKKLTSEVEKRVNLVKKELESCLSDRHFDTTKMHILNDGELTAYGSFAFNDIINKCIYDQTKYFEYGLFVYTSSQYGTRLVNISKASAVECRKQIQTVLSKHTSNKNCKWTDTLTRVPDLLLLSCFIDTDAKHFGNSILVAFISLILYFEKSFSTYDIDSSYLKLLELNLLQTVCDGFHVMSYNMYSQLFNAVPENMQVRLPPLKLKVRAMHDREYFYLMTK